MLILFAPEAAYPPLPPPRGVPPLPPRPRPPEIMKILHYITKRTITYIIYLNRHHLLNSSMNDVLPPLGVPPRPPRPPPRSPKDFRSPPNESLRFPPPRGSPVSNNKILIITKYMPS